MVFRGNAGTMLHVFKGSCCAIECVGTGVDIGSGTSQFTQDFPYVLSPDAGGKPILPDVGKFIHTDLARTSSPKCLASFYPGTAFPYRALVLPHDG